MKQSNGKRTKEWSKASRKIRICSIKITIDSTEIFN